MRGSLIEPVDIYSPETPGTNWQAYQLFDSGVFRLARESVIFYSVMIAAAGSFGRLSIRTGDYRPLWAQPSTFTGSFVLDCYSENGLIVEAYMEAQPFLTISWRNLRGG